MKHIITSLLVLVLAPFTAWSGDIVATWNHKDDVTMELATRDENHIRMNISADNYVLVAGQKVYMVTKSDGQWNVMDMDQLSGLASAFGASSTQTDNKTDSYKTSIKKAGRSETVAGYKGSVYVITTKDEKGKTVDTTEAVFSKHKDIKKINDAWQAIAIRMGNILGQDTSEAVDKASKEAEISGYGGMLRIGEMKLSKVDKPNLEASYYDLPKGAKMVDIGSIKSGDDGAGSSEEGSDFGKEMGDAAEDAAKDAVKKNTVDEIKKGVGGMFKKLF